MYSAVSSILSVQLKKGDAPQSRNPQGSRKEARPTHRRFKESLNLQTSSYYEKQINTGMNSRAASTKVAPLSD